MKHAKVKDDVVLNEGLIRKIESVADEYHTRTGGILLVTDGHRTPQMQAAAMYDNLKHNRGVQYSRKDLYAEIEAAWRAGFERPNYPAADTIADMVKVIDRQILSGRFISQHLVGNAADFSKQADEAVLAAICKEAGHFFMSEIHCLHVTFA